MKSALGVLVLALTGCATHVIHPGAVNTFDSKAYDTLVTIQAALEQASKEVVAYPNLKPELNKAIDGYNAAMVAYKAYHEAAAAGKPTNQAELNTLIQNLSTAVADIVKKIRPAAPAPVPVASLVWRYA